MIWCDREHDEIEYEGEWICTSESGFYLTPTIARELSSELLKWADTQPIESVIGKRYLTRDWEVVKYDGTQDVVARVWRMKRWRFQPGEKVFSQYVDGLEYFVRVSDLPDDMKGGSKP